VSLSVQFLMLAGLAAAPAHLALVLLPNG